MNSFVGSVRMGCFNSVFLDKTFLKTVCLIPLAVCPATSYSARRPLRSMNLGPRTKFEQHKEEQLVL
jgi:hypothetical protein